MKLQKMVLLVLVCLIGSFQSVLNAAVQPTFSNSQSETWYYIQFCRSGLVLTDHGKGSVATIEQPAGQNTQLWKLVGNSGNFQLVNKAGRYVNIKGNYKSSWGQVTNTLRVTSGNQSMSEGLSLHQSAHSSYSSKYEIQQNKTYGSFFFKYKLSFNQWGGTSSGTEVGLYDADNENNPVDFVLVEGDNGGEGGEGGQPGLIETPDVTVHGISGYTPADKHTLWYTAPASNWMEYSLPIGNGQLGASLFGGVGRDEIQFNEKTLWSGTSTSVGTNGNGNSYGKYLNFGSMFITNMDANLVQAKDYHRDLSLSNATGSISFSNGAVDYKREYIVSYPDKVIATHLTATEKGKISVKITLAPGISSSVKYANGEAAFSGKLDVVSYNARVKVVPTGGKVTTDGSGIIVDSADELLVLLAAGTDYDAYSSTYTSNTNGLVSTISNRLEAAANKGWEAIYADHVADYKPYFDRVVLDLQGSENRMTTKSLVDNYNGGTSANDLMLEEMYFNYGRYLSIASSRGVDLPSNLQGIWNNNNNAAWNSDIHANINVQMNYWPTEMTNLTEMHEPFLNYIINMSKSESWKCWAKESGQSRGWTCFTENNIFGGVGVWAHNYVIENAWYCTHLWQHYRYTMDKTFLKKAFPAMLSATQYWLDRLILKDGQYLCPKEYSPEHGPQAEDGVAHAQQLVYELFSNTLDAVNILGADQCGISSKDLKDLKERFAKLDKGLATEKYTGLWGSGNGVSNGAQLLREWKYSNYSVGQKGHRHMSHLMCLYPFSQVESGSNLFNAAVNSLKLRGDKSTGWSMGWKINLWARALNGNRAHNILKLALRHSTSQGVDESKGGIYYNLYDSHAPFQIDGNFGACAGIAEMLFQSHSGALHFLPALPDTWKNGSVSGLKGIGDFTAAVVWKNGKATKITLNNNKGEACLVRYAGVDKVLVTVNGAGVVPEAKGNDTFLIPSKAGDEIVIDFSQPAYEGGTEGGDQPGGGEGGDQPGGGEGGDQPGGGEGGDQPGGGEGGDQPGGGEGGDQPGSGTEVDPAISAAVAKANEAIAKVGVGCPATDAQTRVALQQLIEKPTTVKEIESAISAFMNETHEIEMPQDGMTYILSSVAHNGAKSYFVHAGSGLSVNMDAAKATAYTCKLINGATGEFAFVAPDGKFLVWKGPNGKEGFWFWAKTHGYNDNKGYANSYDATYCDLTLEKLTIGGQVAAKSNADLFGLMTLKGMRYSRNSYSYFAIAPNGAFDGANEPYFDNSYSSAILIEPVEAQAVDFVIGNGDDDDDDDDDDDFEEERWEETTGIGTVEKVMKEDAPVYDLMGRRVTELVKGKIYIKNGKKFFAK